MKPESMCTVFKQSPLLTAAAQPSLANRHIHTMPTESSMYRSSTPIRHNLREILLLNAVQMRPLQRCCQSLFAATIMALLLHLS